MASFAYHPDITQRFPTIVGGVIHAIGVTNGPSPGELVEAFRAEPTTARNWNTVTKLLELAT